MSAETSPRAVRFSQGEDDRVLRPLPITADSDNSNSSAGSQGDLGLHALEMHDELGSLGRYADTAIHSGSMVPLVPAQHANGSAAAAGRPVAVSTYTNGGPGSIPRQPQRPTGPARTPSSTYQPVRKPTQQPAQSFMHASSGDPRLASKPRGSAYNQQEKEYVRRLRAQDYGGEYFRQYSSNTSGGGGDADSDSEGETPSSEGPFDDSYDQNVIIIDGNDDTLPTEEELRDTTNRERLEWHGMLEAVLTGDVVRQEKKRLIGTTAPEASKQAIGANLWPGIRARVCGRHLTVQKRMIEEARGTLDRLIDEVIDFQLAGESETGKSAVEQARDVVAKMDKIESLYSSRTALVQAHKAANSPLFLEACDAVVAWLNVGQLIETELTILKRWVGNDELDFARSRQRSPGGGNGLSSEDSSFLDRLMKEEGLRSLHEHWEEGGLSHRNSMLTGVTATVYKAKEALLEHCESFKRRHLPLYMDELLTLISFPSRLIEEIIRVRLAYAKKMKESAQQNPMMQDQMISQFQVLLKLAIRIKNDAEAMSAPAPGWELPPCIDESFDQVVLDALKYYFKMLNWKLSGNKNTFKEAELLFQEWDFANGVGGQLNRGDIEVAEQFSSLTFKTLNRLANTFEKELQRKPKESVSDMSKRYKQVLESVRVRQRMLQRFSRMLNDNYENAADFSIAFPTPGQLQEFLEQLAQSGHFQVDTGSLEREGLLVIASPSLAGRDAEIQSLIGTTAYETVREDPTDPYILLLRPEGSPAWYGGKVSLLVREEPVELKVGHLRLVAGGSQLRLASAKRAFLDSVDMRLDLLIEQRSALPKVNARLMEIRKVQYKLSNTFMDSVEIIRKQTKGLDYQDLIQTCFVFATEFGQRSLLYLDSNRRQLNNLKLTKLALDWVSFISDDCPSADRKTFRWAVLALEFAMVMTRGRHILALGGDEYARLRTKVAGCMSLLISHFDIMGARTNVATQQAEKLRLETLLASGGAQRLRLLRGDQSGTLDDDEARGFVSSHRLRELDRIDEGRKAIMAERSALGRVLEASNEVDRSLAYLSSTATNFTMRWQQGHFVGGGTFGNVYAAMNLDTGHLMAVKEIRLQDPQLIPTIAGAIKDEMRVLESVDHPNVVSYYGIEVHRDRVYIFMEFCSGGSLASLLEHGRIEDESVIMVYALQLLEGLAYLHEIKIAHRDIKPENILLDHNGIIKYVDFGAAKMIARQGRTMAQDLAASKPNKSMTGTPMYMSPEVIKGENPGHFGAVDIWSLGCVILEMATGRRPWANLDNEWAIMYNIAQGNPPQLPTPDQLSPEGIDFLRQCFVRDSKRRATALDLLHHEWIMIIRNRVVDQPPNTPSDASSSAQNTPNPASSRGSNSGGLDGFY